ncbi:hypothetical protein K2X85_18510 [bacterium]|nr:hypothetical protein [bacterium]
MELRDAMDQIDAIRRQVARTTVFRGYRSVPVAFSGFLAILTAIVQHWILSDPVTLVHAYLALWLLAACASLVAAGVEMTYRSWRNDQPLQRELSLLAAEQFLPSLVAGSMLTTAIVRSAPGQVWMLPGLWSIVFGLGIFASYRLLPAATFWVAAYYMIAGGVALVVGQGPYALSPWLMVLTFGVGQSLAASILYWNLERDHGST